MEVIVVPVLEDNFSYLLVDRSQGVAAAVDPVEPEKVLQAAQANGVRVVAVLTTHKHWDHAGGNGKFAELVSGVSIYGGANDQAQAVTHPVRGGDAFTVGSINVTVLDTPCHTSGHVMYLAHGVESKPSSLFTGDTLFVGGCGRFFEGTAEQMYQALCVTLGDLPDDTLVWCGHEYTVKNMQFAVSVEPDNAVVTAALKRFQDVVAGGNHTVPSTLGAERSFNPFVRCAELASVVGASTPQEAMMILRKRKDHF